MEGRCVQKKITLAYPQHKFTPEDLIHFIESSEFTATWTAMGLDDENDLTSIQLCIMAHPKGDALIPGTGGLRKHHHSFGDWAINKSDVTVYYAYYEMYGIVYLACVDEAAEEIEFEADEKAAIRESLIEVKRELDRLKTIR